MTTLMNLSTLKKAFDLSKDPHELRLFILGEINHKANINEFCRIYHLPDEDRITLRDNVVEGVARWIESLREFDSIFEPETLSKRIALSVHRLTEEAIAFERDRTGSFDFIEHPAPTLEDDLAHVIVTLLNPERVRRLFLLSSKLPEQLI